MSQEALNDSLPETDLEEKFCRLSDSLNREMQQLTKRLHVTEEHHLQQVRSITAELCEAKIEIDEIREEIAQLRKDNAELRKENAELRKKNAELEKNNAELREDKAELRETVEHHQLLVEEAQHMINRNAPEPEEAETHGSWCHGAKRLLKVGLGRASMHLCRPSLRIPGRVHH